MPHVNIINLTNNLSNATFCRSTTTANEFYDGKLPISQFDFLTFLVFLGGACNPTTWRGDTAIPFLEQNKITYFNPVCIFL